MFTVAVASVNICILRIYNIGMHVCMHNASACRSLCTACVHPVLYHLNSFLHSIINSCCFFY